MPSTQPIKITVSKDQWEKLTQQLNYLFKDIYHYLDEIKSVDNKTFEMGAVSYASLTASRLLALDSANVVETTDILSWITGTTNQITVTDDGDGTVTLSIPSGAVLTLANTGLHLLDTNASHDLIIKPGSDLTADRTYTITTGDSDRTITLQGNPTLNNWFDQSVKIAASPTFAGVTLGNTGLHILDTDSSHDLIIKPGSDLTADKTLTITTGDSDRTITLSGNPTLSDWFDQAVKVASTPKFAANLHRQTIPSGTTITVPDDYEFIVGNGYNIEGVLDIQGSGALFVI